MRAFFFFRFLLIMFLLICWLLITKYGPDNNQYGQFIIMVAFLLLPWIFHLQQVWYVRKRLATGEILALHCGPKPRWERYLLSILILILVLACFLASRGLIDWHVLMVGGVFYNIVTSELFFQSYFPNVFRSWLLDKEGIARVGGSRGSRYQCAWVSVQKAWFDEASSSLMVILRNGRELTFNMRRGQSPMAAVLRFAPHLGRTASDQL